MEDENIVVFVGPGSARGRYERIARTYHVPSFARNVPDSTKELMPEKNPYAK